MTRRLMLNESEQATAGQVVATSRGQVIWRGHFGDLKHQRGYDTVHCHPTDGARIRAALASTNITVVPA